MTQPSPWPQIAGHTREALDQARNALSEARDWMNSDWPDGQGPVDSDGKAEAARLISQAKGLIDQAKNALDRSTGR
jgi:hypothetical protein